MIAVFFKTNMTKAIMQFGNCESLFFDTIFSVYDAVEKNNKDICYNSLYNMFFRNTDNVKKIILGGHVVYDFKYGNNGKPISCNVTIFSENTIPTQRMSEYKKERLLIQQILSLVRYIFSGEYDRVQITSIRKFLSSSPRILKIASLDNDVFFNFRNKVLKRGKIVSCDAFACKTKNISVLYEIT